MQDITWFSKHDLSKLFTPARPIEDWTGISGTILTPRPSIFRFSHEVLPEEGLGDVYRFCGDCQDNLFYLDVDVVRPLSASTYSLNFTICCFAPGKPAQEVLKQLHPVLDLLDRMVITKINKPCDSPLWYVMRLSANKRDATVILETTSKEEAHGVAEFLENACQDIHLLIASKECS
jgi:hypothetical protein